MTASQLAANQANALLSTGPVTPEGKGASSRNAIRHGLTAKTGMLASDDPEEYRQHCQVFFDRLAHRDEIERAVIQDIADIEWKLKRIPAIESAILDSGDIRGLTTISIYARRLRRDSDVRDGHPAQAASRSSQRRNQKWVRFFTGSAPGKTDLRSLPHLERKRTDLRPLRQTPPDDRRRIRLPLPRSAGK